MNRLLVLALAWLFAAQPVLAANLPLTGAGSGGNGSGPAAAYDPGGVLFWQEAGATLKSAGNFNGGTDTRHGIVAFRQMLWRGTTNTVSPPSNFRSSANFGNYGPGTCGTEGCLGYMINADGASWTIDGTGFTLRNTVAGADGATPNPGDAVQGLNYAFDYTWQSVVAFYDTNAAANSRVVRVFVDGALVSTTDTQTGIAYDVPWNTTRGICINDCNRNSGLTTGGVLMLSDVIVDTANALPAGCPGTAANCQAVVDAYYKSSKPVNPGSDATKCDTFRASYSASVHTDWCLRGTATTFLANTDGTANAMAVTNDVASSVRTTGNGGSVLYNAPYGQNNAPTDRPYLAWAAPMGTNAVSTTSTTSCTGYACESGGAAAVTGNFGGAIQTGDRLFVAWSLCYSSASPSTTLPTLSSGWTFVSSSTVANPSSDAGGSTRCTYLVATHVATNNYIAVNTPWVAGNPYQDPLIVTYDCIPHGACATAPLQVSFVMFDYRSSNGTVNIDASDFASINHTSNASAPATTPSITTTKATTTLVSLCMSKFSQLPLNPPTGEDVREITQYNLPAAKPIIVVADEKLTSAGATGTRTYTQFGTPSTSDRQLCGLIALANS